MPTSPQLDFVQFLLDRGLLEKAAAAAVRLAADSSRVPIGQILVMSGEMSVRDVMKVLEQQADRPDLRFGELAVRSGLISTVALEKALRQQAGSRLHQITVIRNECLLSEQELAINIVAYIELLELHYKAS